MRAYTVLFQQVNPHTRKLKYTDNNKHNKNTQASGSQLNPYDATLVARLAVTLGQVGHPSPPHLIPSPLPLPPPLSSTSCRVST